MARSSVDLKQYRYEILHECNEEGESKEFPKGVVNKYIHKDIIETILKLGGLVNQLYRARATVAISSGAGKLCTAIDHTASATSVTGFSGLVADAWINGSVLVVDSNIFYSAQITDNNTTTVTIKTGTDLPALSSATVILTANNAGSYLALTGLSMLNFTDPIWMILDNTSNPINFIDIDRAVNIANIPGYDSRVYAYLVGQNLYLAIGSGGSASGSWTIGYYVQPTEATAETDEIDFPIEWHALAQMRTIARILRKKQMYEKAQVVEVDLQKQYAEIEKANLAMLQIDRSTGERSAR